MSTRPIYQQATATSDASGTVLIQLPNVPAAQVWTGAVSVQNSGASTIWTIVAGAAPWGQAIGQAFAPVQCFGSGQIRVSATGTTPGTVFTAVFVGREDNFADAPASPYPVATQVSGTVQIAGTVATSGTTTISGIVTTQTPQRLVGSWASITNQSNVVKTITGLQTYDNFLMFAGVPASGTNDGLFIVVTDGTNNNICYGSFVVTEHNFEWCAILPILSPTINCVCTTVGGVTPTSPPIQVYASEVQPIGTKKLRRAVSFQGAMTAATKQVLLGTSALAKLKSAQMTMSETNAAGATQVHLNGFAVQLVADTPLGYIEAAAEPASTGSALVVSRSLEDFLVFGDGTNNALYYIADNTITLGACTVIYEDLRGV